jgi:hypothetical protein
MDALEKNVCDFYLGWGWREKEKNVALFIIMNDIYVIPIIFIIFFFKSILHFMSCNMQTFFSHNKVQYTEIC